MKNQTEEKWLVNVLDSDSGTGVFLASEYAKFDNYKTFTINTERRFQDEFLIKFIQSDVTYLETIRQADQQSVYAFKWIPLTVTSLEIVRNQAQNCRRVLCVEKCARYGCLCLEGECS